MGDGDKARPKRLEVRIPPPRGQIKAKMLKGLAKKVKGGLLSVAGVVRIPPPRGQIKAKKLKGLAKKVKGGLQSVAGVGKNRCDAGGGDGGNGSSVSASTYISEGHSHYPDDE